MNDNDVSPTVMLSSCIWSTRDVASELAGMASTDNLDTRRAILAAQEAAETLEERLREALRAMGSELHPDGRLAELSAPGIEALDFDEPEDEPEPWK